MNVLLLVSGKRCCGKDTFADFFQDYCKKKDITCMRFALAEECKALYAKENNISFEKLVRDRGFKELHRTAMTQYFWEKGVSFFEDKTLEKICNTVSQVFIITDFRLKSLYEKIPLDRFNVKTVRVNCSIDQREKRGFKFDESKDTDITETPRSISL